MNAGTAAAGRDDGASAEGAEAQGMQLLQQPARIIETLHRLRLHRDLLTVRPLGAMTVSATIVLAVDAAHGIDFDALHPPPQPPVTTGDLLSIRGNVDGSELRFQCRVSGPVSVGGRPALRTDLPDQITVLERRAAHRVRLPLQDDLAQTSVLNAGAGQTLRLTDISQLGAGARTRHSDAPLSGDLLQLRIRLPETTVDATAEVRSVRPLDGFTRLGLRFTDLGRESRQRLIQAIHRIERQLIRYARSGR
jgi:c-di-GMP-binding flagellar brake protein YcgR